MSEHFADYPEIFQLETTSFCNLNCIMCPHDMMVKNGVRKQEHMDFDLFCTIIDLDCKTTKTIGLHILGEPLLHPRIIDMVSYASSRGIAPELATNGTIMTKELAHGLIDAGLSKIWFSLDGVTPVTYEHIRRNATYQNVSNNINLFLDVKNEKRSSITVIVQMVFQPTMTEYEKDIFEEHWVLREGVNKASIKFLDTWAGTLFNNVVPMPIGDRTPCAEPFKRVAVLANGDVVPCCRDWAGRYVYGNLKVNRLSEIWAGNKAELMRMQHTKGIYSNEPCRSCKEWNIPMDRDITVNSSARNKEYKGK